MSYLIFATGDVEYVECIDGEMQHTQMHIIVNVP